MEELLTQKQYEVLRDKGTEPAFCGLLTNNHKKGTYYCIACGNKLFTSDSKFTSGTGSAELLPACEQRLDLDDFGHQLRDGAHRSALL